MRQVQIGPSRVRVQAAVDGECSQMPLFHLRTSELAVLLQLPRRSTWNDPEALASRPPLPRCVTSKLLHPRALLIRRRRPRPKNAPQAAEVCFLRLLHALGERESEWRAENHPRQSPRLTWEERRSVERNGRMPFAKTGIHLFPVPRSALLASHHDCALRFSAVLLLFGRLLACLAHARNSSNSRTSLSARRSLCLRISRCRKVPSLNSGKARTSSYAAARKSSLS